MKALKYIEKHTKKEPNRSGRHFERTALESDFLMETIQTMAICE